MAMATVIWAAVAEVIIMDGAEDAVITTAGHAVIIVTITDTPQESTFGALLRALRCCGTLQIPWTAREPPVRANKGVAMPGLIGYMLAIVITLGGYFAALNWLVRPPDPWQSNAKITTRTAQHVAARKQPAAVKPAEAAEAQLAVPTE